MGLSRPCCSVKVLQAIRANRMDTMGLRGEQSDYNQLSKVCGRAASVHILMSYQARHITCRAVCCRRTGPTLMAAVVFLFSLHGLAKGCCPSVPDCMSRFGRR